MRDKEKQRQWFRDNVTQITGLRPKQTIKVYTENMDFTTIGPENFLISYGPNLPAQLFSSVVKVHVPRSLCRRARISVNKNTGEVIAKHSLNYANP